MAARCTTPRMRWSSFVPSLFSPIQWTAVIASSSIERKGTITAGIKSVLPVLPLRHGLRG
jgi:hypothetical protein